FSVVDGVLLAPLHFREPDRLVAVDQVEKSAGTSSGSETSPASFYDWQAHSSTMRLAGYGGVATTLSRGGTSEPEQLVGLRSIGGLMPVLGVQPIAGRMLGLEDEAPQA